MNDNNVLNTNNLTKKFKKFVVVDKLNLSIQQGDIFGFLGPNGAGKSTTIRMLLGLIKPTSGDIKLFGKALNKKRKEVLRRIGALVEKPGFYSYLSARRNLEIFAALINKPGQEQIDYVLDIVGLADRAHDKVKAYSMGMKQRLGIAQALLGKPEFIILDEPTTGLDPQGMKDIRQLIVKLANEGLTIFLSSHLLHEIEQICNKMVIINRGKLVIQGDVKSLLNYGDNYVTVKVDRLKDAANLLDDKDWIKSITINSDHLKISIENDKIPEMNKILVDANIKVYAIQLRRSLEDYFLSIVEAAHV